MISRPQALTAGSPGLRLLVRALVVEVAVSITWAAADWWHHHKDFP